MSRLEFQICGFAIGWFVGLSILHEIDRVRRYWAQQRAEKQQTPPAPVAVQKPAPILEDIYYPIEPVPNMNYALFEADLTNNNQK
jgi:hypothetical protein